jgi:hypothetical protein
MCGLARATTAPLHYSLCVPHRGGVEVGGGGQRELVFEELRRNCKPKPARRRN